MEYVCCCCMLTHHHHRHPPSYPMMVVAGGGARRTRRRRSGSGKRRGSPTSRSSRPRVRRDYHMFVAWCVATVMVGRGRGLVHSLPWPRRTVVSSHPSYHQVKRSPGSSFSLFLAHVKCTFRTSNASFSSQMHLFRTSNASDRYDPSKKPDPERWIAKSQRSYNKRGASSMRGKGRIRPSTHPSVHFTHFSSTHPTRRVQGARPAGASWARRARGTARRRTRPSSTSPRGSPRRWVVGQ